MTRSDKGGRVASDIVGACRRIGNMGLPAVTALMWMDVADLDNIRDVLNRAETFIEDSRRETSSALSAAETES